MELEQESLFSLEVVVDKLSLPKVACRFPSVAFRLLDFPTLIVHHVEPELGDKIKRKIQSDPHYKLPLQLSELKNKDDQFPVCKGKTCLLKIAPNALNNHLQTTPLYVMVVDTYPETPKLIGNCTIPMDEVMDAVYDDICQHGANVPSTHGEKGVHNIYNLMGKHVGKVILGFRLLSLGRSLISHIPDQAITRSKAQAHITRAVDAQIRTKSAKHGQPEEEPIIVHDLEAADKHVQVAIYPEKPKQESAFSQTDRDVLQTIATQTAKRKNKRKTDGKLEIKPDEDPFNDLVVTNTECPPPLFFNSNLPEFGPSLNVLKVAGKQHLAKKLYSNGAYASPDSEDEFSDDSTIREEDRFSDEDGQGFLTSTKKVRVKNITKPPTTAVKSTKIYNVTQSQGVGLHQLASMPLLNALMNEILALQGVPNEQGRKSPTMRSRSPKTKVENEGFLVRLATPRQKQEDKASARPESPVSAARRRECMEEKAKPVPKNKSWLRPDTPTQTAVKKTKLLSGMTNTQRLRLAKTNPDLLKELERKEVDRLCKLKKPRRPYQPRHKGVTTESRLRPDEEHVSTGRGARPPPLDLAGLGGRSDSHPHKKPVPTPRHSISMRSSGALVNVPPITPRLSISRRAGHPYDDEPVRDTQYRGRYDDRSESDSPSYKSIEVHAPSISNGDYDDGKSQATSDDGSEYGRERRRDFGRTRVLNSPGFPRSSVDSTNPLYSEDFEPSSLGEAPELRRVVAHFSDDDDTEDEAGGQDGQGEVPELRMMNDQYSDHDSVSLRSEARSFVSARSHLSASSKQSKLTFNQSIPNPTSSMRSPPTVSATPKSSMPTREPVAASSTTVGASGSHESSTAYIPRSAVSPDSTISEHSAAPHTPRSGRKHSFVKRPRVTPRSHSIRTDSVSSYAPSEGDDISPLSPGANYSDNFEEISEDDTEYAEIKKKLQHARSAQVCADAKFGYTWTP